MGILAGHYGITFEPMILQFVKEFGMILFIYGIGMLVGLSFFSSFKSGGVQLNIIAIIVVLVGLLLVVLPLLLRSCLLLRLWEYFRIGNQ